MSQERLNDELAAIEAALCSLTPGASGIDRDRLMFLAGRSSTKRRSPRRRFATVFWPTATAASLLTAAVFGILWSAANRSQRVERIAVISDAAQPVPFDDSADALRPSPWENRRLCQFVLEKGIDALPEASAHRVSRVLPAPREDSYRSLLKQYLDNPTG
jgi:hypothetical protein